MAVGKRQRQQAARMGVLLRVERDLWRAGVTRVAGVDEVGVGPLAGPVVAAAVIIPEGMRLRGVDDSKTTDAGAARGACRRDRGARRSASASAWSRWPTSIGSTSIAPRSKPCGARCWHCRACRSTSSSTHAASRIIDVPQTALIHGDARSFSVAAASIVAKVTRDRMMRELDVLYPQYGFRDNMGYGTPVHLAAIDRHGPSPVHRRSFAPVRELRLPGIG